MSPTGLVETLLLLLQTSRTLKRGAGGGYLQRVMRRGRYCIGIAADHNA
jgi:hypothetical protein